jgi:hypothetical protein
VPTFFKKPLAPGGAVHALALLWKRQWRGNVTPFLEWREQYARRYLKVDFEPLAGAIFHASVKPIFPELRRPSGAETSVFIRALSTIFSLSSVIVLYSRRALQFQRLKQS